MKNLQILMRDVEAAGGRIVGSGSDGLAFQTGNLRVIVSNGGAWDHVSVSRASRVPSYGEMKAIKRLCFKPDEWAVEYHAPDSAHINRHPFTLHLWRPQGAAIPTPPAYMV